MGTRGTGGDEAGRPVLNNPPPIWRPLSTRRRFQGGTLDAILHRTLFLSFAAFAGLALPLAAKSAAPAAR